MRKRERDIVVSKMGKASPEKHGEPVCVRPYEIDDKKLQEIVVETGEGKAAIVRRMIRFALSDKQERFGSNRCSERLDWLIEKERQKDGNSDTADGRFEEFVDRAVRLEDELKIVSHQASMLLRELYLMSSVSLSALNILLSRLIELSTPGGADKKQSVLIAAGTMAKLIDNAIRDLEKCSVFHGFQSDNEGLDNLYLATRIRNLEGNPAAHSSTTHESDHRHK